MTGEIKCSYGNEYFEIWESIVHISSQGKGDFIDKCLLTDDSFSMEDWVDAFEWISISLICENCGELSEEWLDAETM